VISDTSIRRVGESTHERSQVEKHDLVIPSPLVINPHAPLRIIPGISSLNSVSPTTRRVRMDDDGRPTLLLQHVVPGVPHPVGIPLGDVDNVVPDMGCGEGKRIGLTGVGSVCGSEDGVYTQGICIEGVKVVDVDGQAGKVFEELVSRAPTMVSRSMFTILSASSSFKEI
jgi:hypothetical protein